jgi:hypothetical protein
MPAARSLATSHRAAPAQVNAEADRRTGVLDAARAEGLLGAKDRVIGGRVPTSLLRAAKTRSGIESDSALLLYALSKVALEDDFGRKLIARKGRIPRDMIPDPDAGV